MSVLNDDDPADLAEAMRLYREWKQTKQDLAARWKRLEQELEVERLKGLQGLTLEGLILAARDPEQRKLFQWAEA